MCNIFFRMVKLEIISLARSARRRVLGILEVSVVNGAATSRWLIGFRRSICAAKRIFSFINLHVNFPIDERTIWQAS